jgi:D-methionine transport system ATP-binding protein
VVTSATLADLPASTEVPDQRQPPVLILESVAKRYPQGTGWVDALAGVDLEVAKGTIQGVIGFSGAGKSTLLRCISRLEEPDRGRVIVDGVDLGRLQGEALRKARRQIGVVFQQFHLLRSRTVAGNIGLALELEGRSKQEIGGRVQELLEWFGLSEKANEYPAQLSGGQRQRVAIARALAMQPAVLLTDEPTSALDPETTASVLALLQRIRKEFGVTVLLITHELTAVRAICDRVAVLDSGLIAEEGPVQDVLLRPQSPAAKRLLASELAVTQIPTGYERRSPNSLLLELQFIGLVAAEPVIADLIRTYPVEVNILRGHIDRINATPYGFLLIELSGDRNMLAESAAWLERRGVGVTTL